MALRNKQKTFLETKVTEDKECEEKGKTGTVVEAKRNRKVDRRCRRRVGEKHTSSKRL